MGAVPARAPPALSVIEGGRAAPANAGAPNRAGFDCGDAAARYAEAARAPATERAYAADWRRWEAWCAALEIAPAAAASGHLADYLATRADSGDSVRTIGRALSGIRAGYKERGLQAPAAPAAVVQGIRRVRTLPPCQARPLLASDMRAIYRRGFPERSSLSALRDLAMLSLAWQGALRRSEIVALDWRDYDEGRPPKIVLRRTKGQRDGAPVTIALISADGGGVRLAAACPKRALATLRRAYARHDPDWRERPIFRSLSPRGDLTPRRLGDHSVTRIVRRRAAAAGLDVDGLSAHSLRAGPLTEAALAGVSPWAIKEHARHKQMRTLEGYVRDIERARRHPMRGLI